MKAFSTLALALAMAAASPLATGQESGHAGHGAHHAPAAHGAHDAHAGHQAGAELTEGEVRKIDREAGKITLRHGEIKNLNMAAMTMVLRVQDPAMLDQVTAGDKVKFAADRVNGSVTIVQLQKVQ